MSAYRLPSRTDPETIPKDGRWVFGLPQEGRRGCFCPQRPLSPFHKYQAGGASEICPPVSLDEETQELIQRAGERAFEALRMDVYSRADFIVSDADGEFYCLEMNALPGMTAASLLPKAAKAAGYEYSELCEAIIQESIKARY